MNKENNIVSSGKMKPKRQYTRKTKKCNKTISITTTNKSNYILFISIYIANVSVQQCYENYLRGNAITDTSYSAVIAQIYNLDLKRIAIKNESENILLWR